MADEGDDTPLLPSTNHTNTTPTHDTLESEGRENTTLGTDAEESRGEPEADKVTHNNNEEGCPPPVSLTTTANSNDNLYHIPPRDIISIFVVVFDPKEGDYSHIVLI